MMKSTMNRIWLAMAILTIVATRVLPEPKQNPAIPGESGVIRGVVTRLGTSEPIHGALISVTKGDGTTLS
jgi:hypothetical protein